MKCLELVDALIEHCVGFPYPDIIKPLWTIRAQIVLDIPVERLKPIVVPVEVGEPE